MSDYQSPQSESDPSGFSSGFFLGLVLGGAGGYFLTTTQGRALLKSLTQDLGDKLQGLEGNDTIKELLAKVKAVQAEKDGVLDTARDKLNSVATRVVEATAHEKPPKRHFFSGSAPKKK